MPKLYFQNENENCYSLSYFKEYMKEHEITELEVFVAKAEFGTGLFFCQHFLEVGEVGNS